MKKVLITLTFLFIHESIFFLYIGGDVYER
jgi:hypothetical protein